MSSLRSLDSSKKSRLQLRGSNLSRNALRRDVFRRQRWRRLDNVLRPLDLLPWALLITHSSLALKLNSVGRPPEHVWQLQRQLLPDVRHQVTGEPPHTSRASLQVPVRVALPAIPSHHDRWANCSAPKIAPRLSFPSKCQASVSARHPAVIAAGESRAQERVVHDASARHHPRFS